MKTAALKQGASQIDFDRFDLTRSRIADNPLGWKGTRHAVAYLEEPTPYRAHTGYYLANLDGSEKPAFFRVEKTPDGFLHRPHLPVTIQLEQFLQHSRHISGITVRDTAKEIRAYLKEFSGAYALPSEHEVVEVDVYGGLHEVHIPKPGTNAPLAAKRVSAEGQKRDLKIRGLKVKEGPTAIIGGMHYVELEVTRVWDHYAIATRVPVALVEPLKAAVKKQIG